MTLRMQFVPWTDALSVDAGLAWNCPTGAAAGLVVVVAEEVVEAEEVVGVVVVATVPVDVPSIRRTSATSAETGATTLATAPAVDAAVVEDGAVPAVAPKEEGKSSLSSDHCDLHLLDISMDFSLLDSFRLTLVLTNIHITAYLMVPPLCDGRWEGGCMHCLTSGCVIMMMMMSVGRKRL